MDFDREKRREREPAIWALPATPRPKAPASGVKGGEETASAGPLVTTFSIVGFDPAGPAWGIAVSSRFLAVGARTCWGAADAGVVVVQAHLNARNGSEGLELLRSGLAASEVIERLMARDPHRGLRQQAVIDRNGGVASYTGEGCTGWAGGVVGRHCAAQGNMLLGGEGCAAMVEHFESSTGSLERRLVNALELGDTVAGDARGRQAAALLVVRPTDEQPFDVYTEPTVDLRVDDHDNPFRELARLLDLHELVYLPTAPDERLPVDAATVARVQRALAGLGVFAGEVGGEFDGPTREALATVTRNHNLRRRVDEAGWPDRRALEYLEGEAGKRG